MRRQRKNPFTGADDIARRYCDLIRDAAKKRGLPEPLFDQDCEVEETLGCGEYGCVSTTDDDECVFKIFQDSSEAHFIQTAIKLRKKGVDPKGIVDFRAVFALPENYEGEPVFVTWRERALAVGLADDIADEFDECEIKEFDKILEMLWIPSHRVFDIAEDEQADRGVGSADYWAWMRGELELADALLTGKKVSNPSEFAESLVECIECAESLENSGSAGYHVGNAILAYLKAGVLIDDLHNNNVGVVERGRCRSRTWAITDTGYSLILREELAKIDIPMLKA